MKKLALIFAVICLCAMQVGIGYWNMMERETAGDAELAQR